jgi:hypothetical protein
MLRRTVIVLTAAALSATLALAQDHSYVVGAAFGAASYEAFAISAGQLEREYNVGFHLGADLQKNAGRATHLFNFDYFSTQSYGGYTPIKIFEFSYGVPIYLTNGVLRPAVVPFFGTRFATSDMGGSQGHLGIMGGVRFKPSPTKCVFSDVYAGWRGRFGTLPFEYDAVPGEDYPAWENGFVFRNANTIEIFLPLCIYITAAVDYDFHDVGSSSPGFENESRKPVFSGGFGPAFYF